MLTSMLVVEAKKAGLHPRRKPPLGYCVLLRSLKPREQFDGDIAQFDIAPLRFVHQSGKRLVGIASVQRDQGSFSHVDVCP